LSFASSSYAWSRNHQPTGLTADDTAKISAALNLYALGSPWSTEQAKTTLADIALSGENVGGQEKSGKRTYTVQFGDSLSAIAASYGLQTGSLLLANPGLEQQANLIHPGQQLDIPDHDATPEQLAQLPQPVVTPVKTVAKSTASTTTTSTSTASYGDLLSPVPYQYISQYFSASHPGLDLVAPYGTPIHSVKEGCIVSATGGWDGGYGNLVIEDLGNGLTARYAHMLGFADGVTPGTCLPAGSLLGYVGLTGNTTGPHLHFELRQNGVPIRPPFK